MRWKIAALVLIAGAVLLRALVAVLIDRDQYNTTNNSKRDTMVSVPAVSSAVVDEKQAAILLGIAPSTLRNLRSQMRGPKFIRIGRRIVYRPDDIQVFLEAHVVNP